MGVPVSLWPVALGMCGWVFGVCAVLLGGWYLWYTLRFVRITRDLPPETSRKIARDLLKVSVVYLPLLLAAMMLNAQGRIAY